MVETNLKPQLWPGEMVVRKRMIRLGCEPNLSRIITLCLLLVGGGSDGKRNKAVVNPQLHEKYHALFSNMTPPEILNFLETYFWANQTKWIDAYALRAGIDAT